MTTLIESPKSGLLPSAANELYVWDSWGTSLDVPPLFQAELRLREKETVTQLGSHSVPMTDAQWQEWPADADDKEYILDAIAENMGLVRA